MTAIVLGTFWLASVMVAYRLGRRREAAVQEAREEFRRDAARRGIRLRRVKVRRRQV